MITLYAIIATFFLGIAFRHNFKEMHANYKLGRSLRKLERDIDKRKKEREALEASTKEPAA